MTTSRWALIAILTAAGPSIAVAQNRPAKRPIDLLKKLSLAEASVAGSWRRMADGGVRCESEAPGRLRLGRAPDDEYDVVVVFTRQEGKGRLGVLLSYDSLDFGWFAGGGRDTPTGGFALLNDPEPDTLDRSLPTLPADDKKRTVRFKVRREGVTAWLGKKKIGEVTDYYDLAALDKNESVGPAALGVLCDRPSVIIHAITLATPAEAARENSKRESLRERSEEPNEDVADFSNDILPVSSTWNGVRTSLNRHGETHCSMKVIERNGPIVVMRMTERGGFSTRWTFSMKRGNLILERCTQEGGSGSISDVQASGAVRPGRLQINYQWVYSGPRAARAIIVGAIHLEED